MGVSEVEHAASVMGKDLWHCIVLDDTLLRASRKPTVYG